MKRILALAMVCTLWIPGVALPKPSPTAPLTGTWECVAHGTSQGDLNFTLYLKQSQDNSVTGWVASPMGSTDLTFVSFKNNSLEIRIDSDRGQYRLDAKWEKKRLSGAWSKDSASQGKWEGKKTSDSPDPK